MWARQDGHFGGFDVAACCVPATGFTATGDFVDVFRTGPDRWLAVLGDVCGKGPRAALTAAGARSVVRSAAAADDSPRTVLGALNRALLDGPSDTLTAICLRLETTVAGLRVTLSSAGHLPSLLRGADGTVRPVDLPGMILGVFGEPLLSERSFTLDGDSTLVLYTDGVTEARHGAEYYDERLPDLLAREGHHTLGEIPDRIRRAVVAFSGGSTRDDLAVLAIRPAARTPALAAA